MSKRRNDPVVIRVWKAVLKAIVKAGGLSE